MGWSLPDVDSHHIVVSYSGWFVVLLRGITVILPSLLGLLGIPIGKPAGRDDAGFETLLSGLCPQKSQQFIIDNPFGKFAHM
jgi:hypothetical protein